MKKSKNPWPELLKAVYKNDIDKVQLLIASGYDVNVQDALGITPLMQSSWGGHIELVQLLLQSGAQVNMQDKKGRSALTGAASDSIATLLLEHGADVHNKSGIMPIMVAGKVERMRLLFQHGAQIDKARAIFVPYCVEGLKLMLQHGADLHAVKDYGENALISLMWPSSEMHEPVQIVRFLVEAGIDINAQDNEGNTALIEACGEDRLEIARELLRLGADAKIKNHAGDTALEYAMQSKCRIVQCAQCLEIKEEVIRLIKNQ